LTGNINPQDRKFWRTYPQHAERATRRATELESTILQKADRSNTLIIVTADHGELLGDDGAGHIYSLKDGNIRVPLYVKYPERWKKKKQKTYIPFTDIPKILDPSTDTIGSDLAIAETFGVYHPDQLFQECGLGNPPANLFYHKIKNIRQQGRHLIQQNPRTGRIRQRRASTRSTQKTTSLTTPREKTSRRQLCLARWLRL
jgi:hypothetical protein